MKKLPIGIQEFKKLREEGCVYVDKTEIIYKLITLGEYYFLSRPRRFGKSLLVNTIKEIFLGSKELFKGLWIYDKIDWKSYPVIKLSFANIGHTTEGLANAINLVLVDLAKQHGVTLSNLSYSLKFQELIVKMSVNGKVVILIDEYDKPIIDYIENKPKAEENRQILKNFYSIIKDNDANIKFLFITGVSKFSQVSIFSELNHLNDITIDEQYSTLLGYTQHELETYFGEYKIALMKKFGLGKEETTLMIKDWYNGYSWNGEQFVYNPYSILNLFSKNEFDDYWFKSATPTFLLKLIEQKQFTAIDFENVKVDTSIFNKYEIEKIDLYSLLFQTGYLTIKQYNPLKGWAILNYPNKEVAKSFSANLLAEINKRDLVQSQSLILQISDALENNDIQLFIRLMTIMFANITYPNIDDKEKYYHSIFYMSLKLIGYNIDSEIITNTGRIDAVLKTTKTIYIIEFKLGTPENAITQAKDKKYYQKFMADCRKIVLLGIGFDTENKNIGGYLEEEIIH